MGKKVNVTLSNYDVCNHCSKRNVCKYNDEKLHQKVEKIGSFLDAEMGNFKDEKVHFYFIFKCSEFY